MMKLLKIFTIIVAAFFFMHDLFAQDLHFSQFFNNPLLTNPANTGFIPDADYRLGASYRNQYSNIMAVPYKTMSIFGDAQVFRNRIETGWLGLAPLERASSFICRIVSTPALRRRVISDTIWLSSSTSLRGRGFSPRQNTAGPIAMP